MTVLPKSLGDVVAAFERTEKHPGAHPLPPFTIMWTFKACGTDSTLIGVRVQVQGTPNHKFEIWEVSA